MTELGRSLARRIAAEGPITVADYMGAALLHPQHGYYMRREPFGRDGDFVTAPEISQMFGELLGLWCVEAWRRAGSPPAVQLVELGPGRGTLMADALRAMRVAPDFLAAASVHLVEASPALRARQREALAGHEVTWHDGLETVPEGPILILANEFLDALPIRQIVRTPDGWHERRIGLDPEGAFCFTLDRAPSPLSALLPDDLQATAVPESLVEVSPAVLGVADTIARRVGRDGVAALFVDYGHARTAAGETLQAVRAHRPHPVLDSPGAADITAHVDFAAVRRAAEATAAVYGPVGQGTLLRRLGIEQRAATLSGPAGERAGEIRAALARLVDADQMGTLFKALAFVPPGTPCPAGFE